MLLVRLIAHIDTDGDGYISYAEFFASFEMIDPKLGTCWKHGRWGSCRVALVASCQSMACHVIACHVIAYDEEVMRR